MKKKKSIAIVLVSLIVGMCILMLIYLVLNLRTDTIGRSLIKGDPISILLSFGYKDNNDDAVMSVVLILEPSTKRIGILEIPSYVGVYDENKSEFIPVNYYYKANGYTSYKDTLTKALGNIALDYMFFNNTNVSNFIDLLGGVEVFSSSEDSVAGDNYAMVLDDSIAPDSVTMDGLDFLQYLSTLHTMEKSDASELLISARRKELMVSIIVQLEKEHLGFSSSKFLHRFQHISTTSLSNKNLQGVLMSLPLYSIDNVYFQRISGVIDTVTLDDVDTKVMFTRTEVGGLDYIMGLFIKQLQKESTIASDDKDGIAITILNGTVVSGLARETKKIYEDAGFRVLSIGNAKSDSIQTTTVIDRVGNKAYANLASQVIGVRSIITDITTVDDAGSEITLILGSDFDGKRIR